ncbi:MAG: gliding motility-associated C-terminal domain-containing protein, partial [Saprospiraceae bacterium]
DTLFGQVGQTIQINGPNGFIQYVWTPSFPGCNNCTTLQIQPDSVGLYQYLLTVSDDHGCESTVIYRLLVSPPCDPQRALIPNAFTPNGDGVNDVFQAVDAEGSPVTASLTIYDRWGEQVYERQGNVSWDGTIDGKPAMSDVYVYLIELSCGGERMRRVGEVSVLR